jgi:hypothetical protein
MLKNNRVTGKLIETRCKACHQPTGYEWVKYKAPGRKKRGAKGNTRLDDFFDMRSRIERELGPKKVGKKSSNKLDELKEELAGHSNPLKVESSLTDKDYEKLAHEDDEEAQGPECPIQPKKPCEK